MSLKDTIRAHQKNLPISSRHEKWLTENVEPKYSERAIIFAKGQLEGITGSQRIRQKMFRASNAHVCFRKQIFAIIGIEKKEEIESKLSNIFATGNFLHLKWQMQGLTEGWLLDAEVPVDRPEIRAGGTMDGVLHTLGGFEFKSINDRGFASVMTYGPKPEHIGQVHNYMFLGNLDHFSVVYENKNTGEWREFLVPADDRLLEEAEEGFRDLNGYLDNKVLPKTRSECEEQTGFVYRGCPYRHMCLDTKEWPK
jgi:hypothetical protein